MTSLSTHVLDTAHGRPATGMAVQLWQGERLLLDTVTDADGRCPGLKDVAVAAGAYRLVFAVADYFRKLGVQLPEPPFLDLVSIDFATAPDGGHYHVPLLVAPFGYSTYRGS